MAKHAFLSASASHRWLKCPPSAKLCSEQEDRASPYAQQGTDCHELCAYLVEKELGKDVTDPTENLTYYDQEMQDCAESYCSFVMEQIEEAKKYCPDPQVLIEQRLDFSRWVENGFGTGDCGKRMRFVKPTDRRYPVDQDHAVYVCGGYLDSGYSRCSRHSIRYPVVAEAVLAAIKVQLNFALKQEQLIRQMRGSVREKNLIDKYVGQINYLSQELKKINGKRENLFENFAEDILDEAEYQFAKKKYDDEAAEIEKKLTVERAKKTQLDDVLSLSNEWLGAIHKAEDITEIDSDLVKHLVSSVKVFEDNRVEVELNFAEQRNIFNLIIAEMAGDGHE